MRKFMAIISYVFFGLLIWSILYSLSVPVKLEGVALAIYFFLSLTLAVFLTKKHYKPLEW